jgi:hypothetical protein
LRERDCLDLVIEQNYEVTIPKKKCIEAFMFKSQQEMKLWRKVQAYNFTMNEKDRSRMQGLESYKNDDLLKEKHGLTNEEM